MLLSSDDRLSRYAASVAGLAATYLVWVSERHSAAFVFHATSRIVHPPSLGTIDVQWSTATAPR